MQRVHSKYKIVIRASFDYEVEVEGRDEQEAKAAASDSLMDYLDIGLRESRAFDDFHEYKLREEVLSIQQF